MDQGGFPLTRRLSTKRSYSQMADPHNDDDPHSLFLPPHPHLRHDDHYNNEHRSPQRRRLGSSRPEPSRVPHFPGDGLDFRRPVMSMSRVDAPAAQGSGGDHLETIDLTDDAAADRVQNMVRVVQPVAEASPAPAASSSRTQRLPHFGRNIIDLDGSNDEQEVRTAPRSREYFTGGRPTDNSRPRLQSISGLALPQPTETGLRRIANPPPRQGSLSVETSDIEVVGSRPRSRVHSRRPTPMPFTGRDPTPAVNSNTIDLTSDVSDDEVILTNIRNNPAGVNGDRPAMAGSVRDSPDYGGMGIGRLANRMLATGRRIAFPNFLRDANGVNVDQRNLESRAATARRRREEIDARIRREAREDRFDDVMGFIGEVPAGAAVARGPMGMVGMMDYGAVAFDYATGGPPRERTPKYEPPPTTGTGFTRSPGEDEVVVCPNCGDELAVGKEEVKQQVWVNKKCGHAYCGECIARNNAPKSRKGKGRASNGPDLSFKECQVRDCTQKCTKVSMIHVYMQ